MSVQAYAAIGAGCGVACAVLLVVGLFRAGQDCRCEREAWDAAREREDAYRVALGLADELAVIDEFDVSAPLLPTGVVDELELLLRGEVER